MRLLFDQNLSPRLAVRLSDICEDALHVSLIGKGSASDEEIWAYARINHLIIVTKDADFGDFGMLYGFPPKIIWLRFGNCTTRHIEMMLRTYRDAIEAFSADSTIGLLTLV